MSMTLSQMRQLLAARGIRLTRSLGQNFLHDGNQLRKLIELAEITPKDRVLEIGPGLGVLTERLAATAGEVLAIEKDVRLLELLRERMGQTPNLRLLHGDALEYLKAEARDWSDWKLVSNLPYSVASPILVELAQSPNRPQRMVCTVQLEVARRLMAGPQNPDYGLLTLLIQLDYTPGGWFKIPATCFFPEPNVDSAGICLLRRTAPLVSDAIRPLFVTLVRQGFSQRRKTFIKLLKQHWPADALETAFKDLSLAMSCRAEELSLQQFAALATRLAENKNR